MGESGFRTFFWGAGFWACSSPVWTKTKSQIVQTGVQTGGRKAMITVYPPDPLMPLGRNRPLTHTSPSHTTTTEQRRGRPLHTLPSGRFPPSALPDLRTFVSWERSRFRSLGVSTLARDLSVRPGMLTRRHKRRTRRHSAMHTPHDAHRGQSAYTNPVKIPMHTPRCMGIPQRIPLGRDRLRYTPHAPRGVDLQYPAWWPLDARAVFLDPGTTRPTEDASSASVVVLLVLCMVDPTTQSKGWGANQIEVHSDHGANTPWSALPGDP